MLGVNDPHDCGLWFVPGLKKICNDYDGVGTNHIAISVGSQGEVDQTVDYLKAHSIEALFETPRHRPEFCSGPQETYYQVMFASPDNLLFEVVYTGPRE
jgi:catechol 2,3-dioxygenase-like lactoylglutathione lyase family enzyme